jgi:predicted metal-dependent peptidase
LNRRNIAGLKGKKKEGFVINAILDTSGSMEGVFENVLSYVFQDNIILNMIQCDTEVKDFKVIKNKNQLSKMSIKGLGGTTLQPAIDYIAAGKLNKVNTVILTDGITDVLNFSKICGKVLIITNETECQIVSNGKVRQIVVEKE